MADERGSLLQRHLLLVQALCDNRPSKGDCQVLAVISGHADADGDAWPGVNRIASKAGIHRTTVLRSVERLEEWGYVEIRRERGRSNVYRIASASSVDATSTSSASATSGAGGPVAPTHTTGSAHATTPVAPALPDQSHPRYPNSALELDSPNSEKRTQLPAALSFDDWVKQEPESEKQKRLASEEEEATKRDSFRNAYREAKQAGNTRLMRDIESCAWRYLADLLEPNQLPELKA